VAYRKFTDEIVSPEMAAILRAKTPAERLQIAFGMWDFALQVVTLSSRTAHPDWSEEQIRRHIAQRMSHGAVCPPKDPDSHL
jgi:hypothetical protein